MSTIMSSLKNSGFLLNGVAKPGILNCRLRNEFPDLVSDLTKIGIQLTC